MMQPAITKGHRRIGRGSFSSVYRKGSASSVLIVSDDPVKECMSLGWFPSSKLFPTLERIGSTTDEKQIYRSKFYPKVVAPKAKLNERAYELYTELVTLFQNHDYFNPKKTRFEHWHSTFDKLPAKFSRERQVLKDALDGLSNYGSDICFEISPRNISCTKTGRLILLDCFFIHSHLMKVRS